LGFKNKKGIILNVREEWQMLIEQELTFWILAYCPLHHWKKCNLIYSIGFSQSDLAKIDILFKITRNKIL